MEGLPALLLPVGLWAAPRRGPLMLLGLLSSAAAAWLGRDAWTARASLRPSLGLWWYFFAELFAPYASLYAALWFALYLGPICALSFALRKSPVVPSLGCLLLASAVFSPRAPVWLAVGAPLLLLVSPSSSIAPVVRAALLASLAALPLSLAARLLWTGRLSGNANFFYAATLLQAGGNLFALLNLASRLLVARRSPRWQEAD